MVFEKASDDKYHTFWNTKDIDLEKSHKKDEDYLKEYKETIDSLSDSEDRTMYKQEAFYKLQRKGSDILKDSVSITDDADTQVQKLGNAYAAAKSKTSGFSGALGKLKGMASGVVASLANMAVTLGISLAVQAVISGITYLVQKDGELRKAAYESSQALKEENKSLEDYKSKITELKDALADSSLTEAESYNTKQQLLSVQDELAEKYGTQFGAIDLVNGSLKEQIGLIDEVIRKNNQDWKIKNQEGVNSNLDNVLADLSNSNILMPNGTYAGLKFSGGIDEASRNLSGEIASFARGRLGADYEAGSVIFNVKTKAELKSQMDELYAFVEDYGEQHQIDVSKTLGSISEAHNYWFDENYENAKKTIDTWAEIEAQENERYKSLYSSVTEARNKYEEAVKDGNQNAQKQSVQTMSSLYKEFQNKEKDWLKTDASGKFADKESAAIAQHFQEIFDEWNNKTVTLRFQMDFKNDKNDIKKNLETAVKNWSGDKAATDVDLQSLYKKLDNRNGFVTGGSAEEELYKNLKIAAEQYSMEVGELISVLVELGVVQSNVAESTPKEYSFTSLLDSESESLKALITQLGEIQSAYQTVQSAISDYNQTGVLSFANLEKIIKLGGEYTSSLIDENGKLSLNEAAYKNLATAKLNKIKIDVINNAIDNVSKLSDEAAAVAYLKDKTNELCESEKDAAKAALENVLASKLAQGGNTAKAAQAIKEQTENMLSLIDAATSSLDINTGLTLGSSNATDEYTQSLQDNNKALEKRKSSLDEQKKALDAVKSADEAAVKALQTDYDNINSLIEQTTALIKHEQDVLKEKYQTEIDGIKDANDAYQKKVDQMKETIDLQAQEIQNQEELSEKQKTVSDIQREMAMLSGDTSAVAKNRRDELASQLSDAQYDLNQTVGEQTREKQKSALDAVAEEHQKVTDIQTEALQKRIDSIGDYLSREGDLRRDAMTRIDGDSQRLYGELLSYNLTYTSTTKEQFDYMWNAAITSLNAYNYAHVGTFAVMALLQTNIYTLNSRIADTERQITGVQSAIDGVSGSIDKNSKALSNYTDNLKEAAKAKESFSKLGNESLDSPTFSAYVNGTRYTTKATNSKDAVEDILNQYVSLNNPPKRDYEYFKKLISNNLRRYATGTRRSGKEVAIIGDDGQEFVLDQPARGQYAQLNNAAVFNARQTDELWSLSKDPMDYIQSKVFTSAASYLSSSSNVTNASTFQISAPITVNGSATREGVEALSRKLEMDLFPKMTKSIMNEMVKVGKTRFR